MTDIKTPLLNDNERLDDLECKSLFVIQERGGYCFNSDSVLVANTVRANSREKVVDLGSGAGVIALLVSAKTKAKKIIGVEIQKNLADMSKRSVAYNNLADKIEIINCDMAIVDKALGRESIDVVVTNPPYYTWQGGEASGIDICRSEVMVTLDGVIETASRLLKYGGRFYMICKVERLADAFCSMREHKIEPKVLRMVVPKAGRAADTFLVEGRKNGGRGLKVVKDLIIREDNGDLTLETRRIYGK